MTIQVNWLTSIPTYLSGLTNLPTHKPIHLGWLTNQDTSIIYPGLLIDHHSGLTERPIYQPIYPVWLTGNHIWLYRFYWQAIKPIYLSGLTNLPTDKPIYVGWLTGLSIQVKWLIICLGWLHNHHTSIIYTWLSGLTVRPLYQPIYPGWLYDQHSWLYIRIDQPTNKPANLSWLTNPPTNQPGWLTDQHTWLSIPVDWPTDWFTFVDRLINVPAYPSRLTDRPTYQLIYPCWLTVT